MPDHTDPPAADPSGPTGPYGQLLRLHAALDATSARLRTAEEGTRALHLLHDEVVQRLFATGMGLQSITDSESDPVLAERLRGYIADLDETIDQLRARVLKARPDVPEPPTAQRRDDTR